MAEIALTASIIAVLQLGSKLMSLSYPYLSSAKDARTQISALRSELLELEAILLELQEGELSGGGENEGADNVTALGKEILAQWLEECKTEIQRLVDELEKPIRERQLLKRFAAKVAWPLKRQDVDILVALVQRKKAGVGLGIGIENLKISTDVQREIRKVSKAQDQELKDKIIAWLKPASVSANYESSRVQCHEQTGGWFLDGSEYNEWKEKQHQFLWLHGIPGCGKTILMSSVVEDIISIRKQCPNVAVAYFFFTFSDTGKQTSSQMLATLVAQMLQQLPELPKDVEYLCRKNSGNVLFTDLLFELVRMLLGSFKKTYWILDALDEVAAPDRTALLDYLKVFLDKEDFQTMSLLFASRREWYLQEVFDEMPIVQCPIQNALVDADIQRYVKSRLEEDPKLKRWPPDIRNEIQDVLTQGANGMFRWVQCQLQAIKACRNANGVRKSLIALPKTLDETYERVLLSISEDDFEFASNALLWIAFAERPMSVQEVAEAVIVDPGEHSLDLNERLIDPNEILEICGSLVVIICERTGEEHVQLAHYSVKEYLVSDRMEAKELARFAMSLKNAQQRIMNVCLTYLSLDCFATKHIYDTAKKQRSTGRRREEYPLLKYAAEQWFKHLGHVGDSNVRKQLEAKAFDILGHEGPLFKNWISEYDSHKLFHRDPIYGAAEYAGSSLYYFSSLGLEDAVRTLIQQGSDVNLTGGRYVTALAAAVSGRHINIARLLLQNGADPDIIGRDGHGYGKMHDQPTPLHLAVFNRDYEMADLLFQYNANVNLNHDRGQLLSIAIQKDDEIMVQKLLKYGAKPDLKIRYSESWVPLPIVAACERGNEKIVRLLLENGADVNATTIFGGNALEVALSKQHDSIVEVLLENNANPLKFSRNRTALSIIAARGDIPLLKRLLSFCSQNQRNSNSGHRYRSFLSHELAEAALFRHIECVKILLDHGADPNGTLTVDAKHGTISHVLDYACSGGQSEILQLLIDHGANVDDAPPTSEETNPDEYHTPQYYESYHPGKGTLLRKACAASRTVLVSFLLERAPNDIARRKYAQLGLEGAAKGKSTEVLNVLIQAGADVNTRFRDGGTALQTAAGTHNGHMIEPLLDRGADPDATEPEQEYIPGLSKSLRTIKSFEEGRTALHIALRNTKTATETLLRKGANPNAGSRHKKGTPLCVAVGIADFDGRKDYSLIQTLLDHGADINAGGGAAPTPLMAAMEICRMWRAEKSIVHKSQLAVIEFLLENGADPNQVAMLNRGYDDIEACTPLRFARHWKMGKVEKLLLKYGAKNDEGTNVEVSDTELF